MLRVLTLSTLFPDAARPNFGVFVERQTAALAARAGVGVRVVAPLGLPPFPLSLAAQYRALARLPVQERWHGLDVVRPRFLNLPGTQGRWHAAMMARALVPLLTAIRRDFPFDVIDAEFFFPDGPAAILLGQHFGVPVSIKARGADIHHWGRQAVTAAQVRMAGAKADGLLAVSQALAEDMAALGMPAHKISVHRTGIDRQRFHPRPREVAKAALGVGGPLVLSIGALIPRKRHALVIEAMARLPGVILWIVGEGPERPALTQRIAALGLDQRVRLLGAVAHDSMGDLLAAADLMALASESEGLANAWVEALASGTPVVITDAGGARELIDRPAAGRIVAPSPDALAAAMADLLADPPPRDAVATTVERYSWEANGAALFDHLSALVTARRQSRG